uniref:Putative secreted protein n=1 Tax=Anopheles triannulatus TaxID=58253 RepID=A0A2M4B5R7_9DIPT
MAATTRTMGGKLPLFLFCSFFPLWLTTGREGVSTTCSRTAGERERDHWSLVCARVAGAIESSRVAEHFTLWHVRARSFLGAATRKSGHKMNPHLAGWLRLLTILSTAVVEEGLR